MKYIVGESINYYRVQSFDESLVETISFREANELKEKGELIGLDWGGNGGYGRELSFRQSSYTVDTNNLDLHYIKNTILNCNLSLSAKLRSKFGIATECETVAKDFSYVTYRLTFRKETYTSLVAAYLHDIGLVNFDLLGYDRVPVNIQLAFLRIKLSTKYAEAAIAHAVSIMRGCDNNKEELDFLLSYAGLGLNFYLYDNRNYWSVLQDRYETEVMADLAQKVMELNT